MFWESSAKKVMRPSAVSFFLSESFMAIQNTTSNAGYVFLLISPTFFAEPLFNCTRETVHTIHSRAVVQLDKGHFQFTGFISVLCFTLLGLKKSAPSFGHFQQARFHLCPCFIPFWVFASALNHFSFNRIWRIQRAKTSSAAVALLITELQRAACSSSRSLPWPRSRIWRSG